MADADADKGADAVPEEHAESVNYSVESARTAEGELAAWVLDFLASDGSDNEELGQQLSAEIDEWMGPVRLPFDQLHRLAGPADEPTLTRMTDDDEARVDDMTESTDEGWEPPPLVVTVKGDQLVLEDGNHRVEALRQQGDTNYWAVVGLRAPADRALVERANDGLTD